MTTSDKYLALTEKRLLGWQSFKDHLFDYWNNCLKDLQERIFSRSGTFYQIDLGATSPNTFNLSGYPSIAQPSALDGEGNLLDLKSKESDIQNVLFENTLGATYYIGLRRADIPSGHHINPADGMPFFDAFEEIIGWSGTPNTVTDNGNGTLTFIVDSVTQPGVNFAGRKVKVWKISPGKEALTESIAIEECTVAYSAPNNRITTAANFGQGTTPSTDTASYVVVLIGPRVSTTDFSSDLTWCFIGTVLGAGSGSTPTTFDISDQYIIETPLVQLSEVFRTEPSNGRLKIDVKALGTEVGIDQIRVTKLGDGVKFQVDEDGNVTIQGDLEVQGTEIVHNTETVYSDETITGNLTAGDATSDSHKIVGTWRHADSSAGTKNYFRVDGTDGRIGISTDPTALTARLTVAMDTGDSLAAKLEGDTEIDGNLNLIKDDVVLRIHDLTGPLGKKVFDFKSAAGVFYGRSLTDNYGSSVDWLKVTKDAMIGTYTVDKIELTANSDINLTAAAINLSGVSWFYGNLAPSSTNTRDIGTDSLRFKDIWIEGILNGNDIGLYLDGTTPGWVLDRTADSIADRRYWECSTLADGTLDFRGRNETFTLEYTWLKATKKNASGTYHQVERIDLNSVGTMYLNAPIVYFPGTTFQGTTAAGQNLGTAAIMFASAYAKNVWAISGTGSAAHPAVLISNADATSGQRVFRFQVDDAGELTLSLADDAGALTETILNFERDAENLERVTLQSDRTNGLMFDIRHTGQRRFGFGVYQRTLSIYEGADDGSSSSNLIQAGYDGTGLTYHVTFVQGETRFATTQNYPSADNYCDLGKSDKRWQDFYCMEAIPNVLTVQTGSGNGSNTLEPVTNSSGITLGSSSYNWYAAYIDRITLGTGSGEGMQTSVYPATDDPGTTIGAAARRWSEAYVAYRLRLHDDSSTPLFQAGSGTTTDDRKWEFQFGTSFSLFTRDQNWTNGQYVFTIARTGSTTTIGNLSLYTGIIPSSNAAFDLGNTSYQWNNVWTNYLWVKGGDSDAHLYFWDTAGATDQKIWKWQTGNSGQDLWLYCMDDANSTGNAIWRYRRSGTSPSLLSVYCEMSPGSSGINLGSASFPYQFLYAWGVKFGGYTAGEAGFVNYTGQVYTGSAGATFTVVGTSGTTNRNSAGFLRIYSGTTPYYIPFFSAYSG